MVVKFYKVFAEIVESNLKKGFEKIFYLQLAILRVYNKHSMGSIKPSILTLNGND